MRNLSFLKITLLAGLALLLASCEKLLIEENPSADPRDSFESMWQTLDQKYSYFKEKNINWDSVYSYYDPMVDDQMTREALFEVLDSMLYDLRDGHVNLVSPFNTSRNWQWYLDSPENFSFEVIERHYLKDDYRIAGGFRYRLIDSVGYLYYGSFGSGFSEATLDDIFTYLAPAKGLVVDVRNNGGGSLGLVFRLAQRFVNAEQTLLLTREKTGPSHQDFGNELSYTLSPSKRPNFTKPIALLTNRSCYSATNTFAGILSQLPQVTQIGDQTGGGGGVPVDYELPNGWRYRFSATQTFIYNNQKLFEIEGGVAPDFKLDLDPQNLINGEDDILEAGLSWVR